MKDKASRFDYLDGAMTRVKNEAVQQKGRYKINSEGETNVFVYFWLD
jgi:hypothetical protein